MEQIQTLGEGVDEFLVLGGILSEIHLRLAVTGITVILTLVQEVRVRLVIVLVEDGHTQLFCQFPTSLEVRISCVRTRTGRTHDDDLGMSFHHAFIDILEALDKLRRDLLLVTDTEVLQVEGLRMTGVSTHLRPFVRGRITVGPLDEVYTFVHPLVHLRHRHHVLSLCRPHVPATVGTLTAHTGGQDGYGLHA